MLTTRSALLSQVEHALEEWLCYDIIFIILLWDLESCLIHLDFIKDKSRSANEKCKSYRKMKCHRS